jgi:hypothetical protein
MELITYRTVFVSLLIAFVYSCSGKVQDDYISIELNEEILEQAVALEEDSVWYPAEDIYAEQFYVYADSILIVNNKKNAGNFIDLYDINSHQIITKLFPYGEGPEELLYAETSFDGCSVRVMDYINRKLHYVNMDKAMKDSTYKPESNQLSLNYIITSAPIAYGDSIVYVNPFHYTNKREKINQLPPRLFSTQCNSAEPEMPINFKYMTVNVGQGILGDNANHTKIFFASYDESVIEFYDSNLKLRKKVLGPVSLSEARLSVRNYDGSKYHVCYKGSIQPEAYTGYTCSNDKLYFVYTGKEISIDDQNKSQSYILCFDWEGNIIKSYKAPVGILSLSPSNGDDVFYATILNNEGNPKLVKFTASY